MTTEMEIATNKTMVLLSQVREALEFNGLEYCERPDINLHRLRLKAEELDDEWRTEEWNAKVKLRESQRLHELANKLELLQAEGGAK